MGPGRIFKPMDIGQRCQLQKQVHIHKSCQLDIIDHHGKRGGLRYILIVIIDIRGTEFPVKRRYGRNGIGAGPAGVFCKLYGFLCADVPYMYNNRYPALYLVNDCIHHQVPLLHGHGKALACAACKIETVSPMLQHELHHASGTIRIHILFLVKERQHCRDHTPDLIHFKSAHFSLLFNYICVLKSIPAACISLYPMAAHHMLPPILQDGYRTRDFRLTLQHTLRASGMERTAGRRIHRAGDIPL